MFVKKLYIGGSMDEFTYFQPSSQIFGTFVYS